MNSKRGAGESFELGPNYTQNSKYFNYIKDCNNMDRCGITISRIRLKVIKSVEQHSI